jgi:hypothetical protein
MLRVGSRFGRVELRRRARAFVLGLLAELPRKNCWTIAEQAGDATPDGMQHLLARAQAHPVCLEEFALAYLREPGAAALPAPPGSGPFWIPGSIQTYRLRARIRAGRSGNRCFP